MGKIKAEEDTQRYVYERRGCNHAQNSIIFVEEGGGARLKDLLLKYGQRGLFVLPEKSLEFARFPALFSFWKTSMKWSFNNHL
jgi:hypothetical protein